MSVVSKTANAASSNIAREQWGVASSDIQCEAMDAAPELEEISKNKPLLLSMKSPSNKCEVHVIIMPTFTVARKIN